MAMKLPGTAEGLLVLVPTPTLVDIEEVFCTTATPLLIPSTIDIMASLTEADCCPIIMALFMAGPF
jgi:hypothetical protein